MRLDLIIKPLALAITAVLFLQYSGLDSWFAGNIYTYLGGWTLRDNWFLQTVIHQGGRNLIALIVTLMLLGCIITWGFYKSQQGLRKIFIYLSISTAVSLLLVAGLKKITTLPCPWSMLAFGGTVVDTKIAQVFSSESPLGHCFPAGHSSGGFALFSIYFAARIARDNGLISVSDDKMKYFLLPGLVLGVVFGLAQELRGAHFLSHDITTAALCWLVSTMLWLLFFAPSKDLVKQEDNANSALLAGNKISSSALEFK